MTYQIADHISKIGLRTQKNPDDNEGGDDNDVVNLLLAQSTNPDGYSAVFLADKIQIENTHNDKDNNRRPGQRLKPQYSAEDSQGGAETL